MEVRGNVGGPSTTPLAGSESYFYQYTTSPQTSVTSEAFTTSGCGVYTLPSGNNELTIWMNGYSIGNPNANSWIIKEGNIIAKVWRAV